MDRESLYQQLVNSDPIGFIDPFEDLGDFDSVQMKFKEPVSMLKNKYSGQPYNLNWQKKIEEMRVLYIQYQKLLKLEDQEQRIHKRLRNKKAREHVHEIVTTYLRLGFRFREIESKVALFNTRLRRNWKRSDYVMTVNAEFYLKKDLQNGYCSPNSFPPGSMKVN